jgi:UDP-N-acetylmuramate dehydrogenase
MSEFVSVTDTAIRDLAERLRGTVRRDESLAPYTTYRIGGPAAAFVMPSCVDDVQHAVRFAAEFNVRWMALGLGSNVLVSDEGFDGIVLRLGKGLDRIETRVGGDDHVWRAGAGLPTPLLARRSAKAGLSGVHRLVGVPGTVGGGVYMNAGAHGQDFATVVRAVEIVNDVGGIEERRGGEIPWRYRSSGLGRTVVLSATVDLTPEDPALLARDIRKHFEWRKAGTPFNEPCCGSVFRNPDVALLPEDGPRTAGQLIDAAGLKGQRIGGAEVSGVHANYIVNTGGATATDVLALIDTVRERVHAAFGVELQLEVQCVGGRSSNGANG